MRGKVSLIVQPGDSFFPIVRAFDRAERSVNLTVFRMDDPIILKAMLEARSRGVRTRLLIASSARGWGEKNQKLLRDAKKAGIATREPAGDSKKTRFHYKIMTVDGTKSLIFTFNPTRENLHYTRDFGLELFDRQVAAELDRLFDADWDDIAFTPDAESPLLISPYNSRAKMAAILGGAQESIRIADAKLEDPAIVKIVADKARDGVKVRVLGDAGHEGSFPPGIEFRAVPRYKLHAKCSIVDGKRAVLGSMNMRTESFDRRREVCIAFEDPEAIKQLEAVFESDWEQKAPTSASAETVLVGAARPTPSVELSSGGYILVSRTDALRRHPVREGVTTIGRSEENDVVVADPLASRFHARITLSGDECVVTDLGSHNGTFVNGERIETRTPLRSGDVLDVAGAGEYRLFKL
jgi:phosphatidylserine/phosphatidylglycerophosphate/cardiolipin synthase-like enzyme